MEEKENIAIQGEGNSKPTRRRPRASNAQPLYFGATLIVGILIGTYLADTNLLTIKTGAEENPNKLVTLIDYIEETYVDSVDKKRLIDDAIESILSHLDPHSYYINPDELAVTKEKMNGEYQGIGMEFMVLRDTLRVVKTMNNSPAQKGGLQMGDKIIEVDGKLIAGQKINSDKVQKLIKGKAGSEVKLTVLRKSESAPLNITLQRGNIPIESVTATYKIAPGVGYLKIESFAHTTFEEFQAAMRQLIAEDCQSVVIDLRGNGGGLLEQSFLIAESFLPKDKLVLFTKGMHFPQKNYITTQDGEFRNMEVTVLVDQNSASASEILAGALQDWDKSTTVGRRTFGKGLVQHEIELPDRSAFRLTIARYYTPTGRCIQKPYSDSTDYGDDFAHRYVSGELFNKDSIAKYDSLKFTTPGGKTVYASGGITPDIFIPLDTSNTILLTKIASTSIIRDASFEFIENNKKALAKYKNEDEFVEKFKVPESLLQQAFKELKKAEIPLQQREWNAGKEEVRNRLKANIGRYLYSNNVVQKVIFSEDRELQKAVEITRNKIKKETKSKK
jgi:carboxyl-terminal processing protease